MSPILVAGLEIGSTKTCAVIVEIAPPDAGLAGAPRDRSGSGAPVLKIMGVGQSRTGGVRRNVVTDIDETTESVRTALHEAELMAGAAPDELYVGVAGEHIAAERSTGVVAVSGEEIRQGDVDRVQEVARAVVVPDDREVLHVLPQEYIVDHQAGIRDPIGMAGTRLEAEVYIITSAVSAGQNLRKAVDRAGFDMRALVYEPLATAHAVLTEDEMEIGVALVDLGGGTTEVAVFRDGKMTYLASVPWGGAAVTSDIAQGLSIPFAEAERTKERDGTAFAELVDPRQTVELPGPAKGETRAVARELIAHIIEQRTDEILGLVANALEEAGEGDALGAGVVLTGGGASLEGTVEVAQHVFGAHVRVGVPGEELAGLSDTVRRPKFATATGLALYGAQRERRAGSARRFGEGVLRRALAWLKEFF